MGRIVTWHNNLTTNVIEFMGSGDRASRAGGRPTQLEQVRAHDWAATPLGPMEGWREPVRSVVDLVLASPVPMACLIGSCLVPIFNDAMADLPGSGDELMLGVPAHRAWPSEWPAADALERARLGERLEFRALPRLEQLSYAPLSPGAEAAGGVLVVAVPARARPLLESAEVEHRARNTLSLLRSIVARSAPLQTGVEEFAMHLQGRIEALARIQLAGAVGGHRGIDLATLVAEELQAAAAHEDEQVTVEGPPVSVGFRAAEKIGLAVHELATNALKYGALAEPEGTVEVRWRIDSEREPALVLDWTERGVAGPVVRLRDGFGSELIERALPYELAATTILAFEPGGARCTMRFPLAKLAPEG